MMDRSVYDFSEESSLMLYSSRVKPGNVSKSPRKKKRRLSAEDVLSDLSPQKKHSKSKGDDSRGLKKKLKTPQEIKGSSFGVRNAMTSPRKKAKSASSILTPPGRSGVRDVALRKQETGGGGGGNVQSATPRWVGLHSAEDVLSMLPSEQNGQGEPGSSDEEAAPQPKKRRHRRGRPRLKEAVDALHTVFAVSAIEAVAQAATVSPRIRLRKMVEGSSQGGWMSSEGKGRQGKGKGPLPITEKAKKSQKERGEEGEASLPTIVKQRELRNREAVTPQHQCPKGEELTEKTTPRVERRSRRLGGESVVAVEKAVMSAAEVRAPHVEGERTLEAEQTEAVTPKKEVKDRRATLRSTKKNAALDAQTSTPQMKNQFSTLERSEGQRELEEDISAEAEVRVPHGEGERTLEAERTGAVTPKKEVKGRQATLRSTKKAVLDAQTSTPQMKSQFSTLRKSREQRELGEDTSAETLMPRGTQFASPRKSGRRRDGTDCLTTQSSSEKVEVQRRSERNGGAAAPQSSAKVVQGKGSQRGRGRPRKEASMAKVPPQTTNSSSKSNAGKKQKFASEDDDADSEWSDDDACHKRAGPVAAASHPEGRPGKRVLRGRGEGEGKGRSAGKLRSVVANSTKSFKRRNLDLDSFYSPGDDQTSSENTTASSEEEVCTPQKRRRKKSEGTGTPKVTPKKIGRKVGLGMCSIVLHSMSPESKANWENNAVLIVTVSHRTFSSQSGPLSDQINTSSCVV
jgi:hypothetical protein